MIHLIGMSHGLSVVNAFDRGFAAMDMKDFEAAKLNERSLPSGFTTLKGTGDRPHLGGMKMFLIPRQRGWGGIVRPPDNWNGDPNLIGVHRGFVEMTSQVPSAPGTIVLSMLFGHEHTTLSLVESAVPYDFVLPTRPDITPLPGRQVMFWPAVRAQLQDMMRQMAQLMPKMRALLPAARLVHCAPPPPVESEEQILAMPEILGEKLAKFGVTPAPVRLKYYLAQLEELARIAKESHITLLGPPPAAMTPAGMLRPEFWHGSTHANADYGDLVLDQLEQWVKREAA